MRRLLAVVAVVLVAAGCGVRPSGVIPGLAAPSGPAEARPPSLYFVSGDTVVPVVRTPPPGGDPIALLAKGPAGAERASGLRTEVPRSAALATVTRSGSDLVVSLGTDVAVLTPAAVDQIVCTLLTGRAAEAMVRTVTLRGGGHTVDRRTCPV